MLRNFIRLTTLATLLATTVACTQASAPIDLRGSNSYNKSGGTYAAAPSSYSSFQPAAGSAPVPMQTQSSAAYSSIGVSDLSAPAANGSSSAATPPKKSVWNSPRSSGEPFKPAAKDTSSVEVKSTPVATNSINPWTHKPHESTAASNALDESFHLSPKGKANSIAMVSDVKTTQTAKLDSIVDSSDEPVATKEVALTHKIAKAETGASGMMWPVNSKKILSDFGPKGKGKINDGVNIASAEGEPVWAAGDGEIIYVGNELQGYGNMVIIKHPGTKTTTYAHLNRYTVDKYEHVKQGDIIGYVGTTGNVKSPQLHFAVRDGKDPVDPLTTIKRDVASRD